MKRSFVLLWSIVAVIALISVACGGDSESGTTASTGTTATSTSTPTTTSTSTPTTTSTTETSTASEPATPEPGTVTVYFSTEDGSDCGEVSPFTRTVQAQELDLGSALTELLAGPTDAEIEAGATSFFSRETYNSLAAIHFGSGSPGLTRIEFNDLQSLIPNASTSCGSEALLAQLNQTVLQFVPRVRYEILGSCQMFANWLQRECMEYTSEGAEPAVLTTLERAGGSGCAQWEYGILDGLWFGYVESTTDYELTFDLACWFDGDAALDAASEDGQESPPPNDYYIRNDDDTLEAVPVASSTAVSWLADTGDPSTQTNGTFGEWMTLRDSRTDQPGLWLTVRDGQVVEIVEQYVP